MEIVRSEADASGVWLAAWFWHAIMHGQRVGQIAIRRVSGKPNIGYLSDFEVNTDYQGLGIGTNLLLRALEDSRMAGVEMILVCSFIQPESRAHNLFAQAKFVPISNHVFVSAELTDRELKL